MSTRAELVACARTYLGVPFRHQGRDRFGVDCAGLPMVVARDCGLVTVEVTGYGRQPDPAAFRLELGRHLEPIGFDALQPGDVVTFAVPQEQHIGIVTELEPLAFIHSFQKVGRVVEQTLSAFWLARLRGCYRIQGLA